MDHIRSYKGGKKMARKRSRKRKTTRRRVRRNRSNPLVRAHRRSPARKRSHRRRYRSNPRMPRTAMGFVGMITNGVIDAGEVVLGKAGARLVPQTFGIPTTGAMGLGVQVLSAVVIGWLGTFISGNASKMLLAGGLAAPVEDFLKTLNLPIIGPALGEDVVEISSYPQDLMGAYPGSGDLMGQDAVDAVYSQ